METDVFGVTKKTPLRPGGGDAPVTAANREEYVRLYAQWKLEGAIDAPFEALQRGFLMMCNGRALELLRPVELETLVVGAAHLDFKALEAAAVYEGGYSAEHQTIRNLWQARGNRPGGGRRSVVGARPALPGRRAHLSLLP